ncbi:MAG: hypothetical protein HN368_05555, partial [Spirochaetales bacterium]|nr:hypothetical protein [Spirochaetales bacterium]
MKKTLFIYIAFFLVTAALSSMGTEDGTVPAYEEFPEALGFQYGEISGTGLSYQSWNGTLGLQYAA